MGINGTLAYGICKRLRYIWLGVHDSFPLAGSTVTWPFVSAVSDKDEESEDMSIPGSPQNEAIQHSSISTSNGVGSASVAPAASAPSSGATTSEESQPRRDMAQAQPPGSWWSCSRVGCAILPVHPRVLRGKGLVHGFSSDHLFIICFWWVGCLLKMFSLW